MKKFSAIIAIGLAAMACNRTDVRLNGRFGGYDNRSIYLELVSPSSKKIVDSVATDATGNFRFDIKLPGKQPAIYNLRSKEDAVTLLLSPGERVFVSSVGDIAVNYTVEGSEESALVRDLNRILSQGMMRLDSMTNVYSSADPETRKAITKEFAQEYFRIKRAHVGFLVSNAQSLAAVYGLYQRLPNDAYLFNGESDYIYYRMVADSASLKYPASPYVLALQREVEKINSSMEVATRLIDGTREAVNHPDIELPDMYGNKHKLSELDGKVIVLEFWSAAAQNSNMLNAELKELYGKYADRGLEIYQVSVDKSKPLWVTTVQDQKLPWISVCDFKGEGSPAVMLYNVTSVPANFIIDRDGMIAAKNLTGKALEAKIAELL